MIFLSTNSIQVPPYAFFFMCCTSYRIHSIFILRLFNDPVAMLFLYLAVNCFLSDRWNLGCFMFRYASMLVYGDLLFCQEEKNPSKQKATMRFLWVTMVNSHRLPPFDRKQSKF